MTIKQALLQIVNRINEKIKFVEDKIPTKLSQLSQDTNNRLVTDKERSEWNAKSDFSGNYNDLSNKPPIPTKTSDLTNDSGFITKDNMPDVDLSKYSTTAENDDKYQPKGDYLEKIPDEFITEAELNTKGYLTQHQDLSDYAKKSAVPTKTSQLTNDSGYLTSVPSEYVTETELNARIPEVPTVEETLKMLADAGIIDVVTDESGNIPTDADGNIFVF